MPFKSKAQRAKLHALAAEGKIDKDTVAKWESETPKEKHLPERINTFGKKYNKAITKPKKWSKK